MEALNFPNVNLAKIQKLHPNRVHNGGGCVGDCLIYRGSNTNLLDSNTGNNMGRVTVNQILRRGPTVRTTIPHNNFFVLNFIS